MRAKVRNFLSLGTRTIFDQVQKTHEASFAAVWLHLPDLQQELW